MAMAEPDLDRLDRSLDTSFQAVAARADEEAANDLAGSLLRGLDVSGAIRRWGAADVRLGSAASLPVEEVGRDYLECSSGDVLVPMSHAVVLRSAGARTPRFCDEPLRIRLSEWARMGREVQVTTHNGETFSGRLVRSGADHLELSGASDRLVGLGAVAFVRLSRGG